MPNTPTRNRSRVKKKLEDLERKPPAYEGVRAEFRMTDEEFRESSVEVGTLTPGDWFMVNLASWDLQRTVTFTGKLVYPGVGSCLVQIDRTWEDRLRWSPQAPVVPLGINDRDREFERPQLVVDGITEIAQTLMVEVQRQAQDQESLLDLGQFCEECGTMLDPLRVCWEETGTCSKIGMPQG